VLGRDGGDIAVPGQFINSVPAASPRFGTGAVYCRFRVREVVKGPLEMRLACLALRASGRAEEKCL